MSQELRQRLYDELDGIVLIDPHTHINARDPASQTLADILGYHYYTELAHSAGMPKDQIEEPGLDPKEKVARLISHLGPIDNTVQYSWLVEMAHAFFGFDDERITADNWEPIYDCAVTEMSADDWPDTVLALSKLEAVFLTNDFDDPLEGFDTSVYIPCLRTDDLVFHLAKPEVRDRLAKASDVTVGDAATLWSAIRKLFDHFASKGARACAISLPPNFTPTKVSEGRANTAIAAIYSQGLDSSESDRRAVANFVFWTLAGLCADFRLPFDLMIGVNRGVYEGGVYQGQDLYDSRVSLIQYKELFNSFPQVTFPISVLASVTNQELVSYSWIFPNVVTNGHWWYSNTPSIIEHDAAARLEAVPRTKQIAYYSDMYKLEFALPKFNMYKRVLAKILAERFVIDHGWTEEQVVAYGKQILRDNVDSVFRIGEGPVIPPPVSPYVAAAAAVPLAAAEPADTDDLVDSLFDETPAAPAPAFEEVDDAPVPQLEEVSDESPFDFEEVVDDAPAGPPGVPVLSGSEVVAAPDAPAALEDAPIMPTPDDDDIIDFADLGDVDKEDSSPDFDFTGVRETDEDTVEAPEGEAEEDEFPELQL